MAQRPSWVTSIMFRSASVIDPPSAGMSRRPHHRPTLGSFKQTWLPEEERISEIEVHFRDEDEDYDGDFYLLTDTAGRVWFHSEHGLYMDLEVTKLRRSFLSSICRMVQQWYLARYKSHRLEHVTGTNLERGLSDSAAGRDSLCAGHHGGERVHDAHPSGKDPRTTPLTASDREGQA